MTSKQLDIKQQKSKMTPLNILKDLTSAYNANQVSALVGAGFSMNVSDSYKSWAGLLFDMFKDVYEDEIERYYQNYLHLNYTSNRPLVAEADIKNKYIEDSIKKEDLLKLVFKYIKKHGYRECVDAYIEKRTPFVKLGKDKIVLSLDGKTVELSKGDFSAHISLLMCDKLLNIYTTNYDNLLEFTNKELLESERVFGELPITTAIGLSDKISKKSIIKIHGSLRNDSDSSFGFDNDNDLCYIIAQEDYDTYMTKHEAFSYMMRIAMLSGKFCLLGFSGTDANYLAWVKWMRDIIVVSEDSSCKIYLVSVENKPLDDAQKLFNKNHNIEVLNLYDSNVLNEIGLRTDIESKSGVASETYSRREVITAFLDYLRKNSSKGSESLQSSRQEEGNEKTELSQSTAINFTSSRKFEYKQLWQEANEKLSRNESLNEVANKIIEAKKEHRLVRIIYPQERFTQSIAHKKKLTDGQARIFAIAFKDQGLLPEFFPKEVKCDSRLEDDFDWNMQVQRNFTIKGDNAILEGAEDPIMYENIMRMLFNLDFSAAKNAIAGWNPNDFWIQHGAMLKAIFSADDKKNAALESYILNHNISASERLYARNIANYIDFQWPQKYNCDELYSRGYDGLGDIQAAIIQNIRGKSEKPKTMGWIGSCHNFGSDYSLIKNSIRLIQFLMDSGVNPHYYHVYFLSIEDWYLVAHNLLRYYPYPCFYYSCQYCDNDVLRRIGQEFAYCKDLEKENEDLLQKSLIALNNPDTPELFKHGLHLLTGRIYRAVDEDKWYSLFVDDVFMPVLLDFGNKKSREEVIENIELGIGALSNSEHIEFVFEELIKHFDENPELVCSIVENNLFIRKMTEEWKSGIVSTISMLVKESTSESIFRLLYHVTNEKTLPVNVIEVAIERIQNMADEMLPANPFTLTYMLLIAQSDASVQHRIKTKLVTKDLWHCGLMDNGSGYSNPNYIRLNLLEGNIEWSDDEFSKIAENIIKNVKKLKESKILLSMDSFIRNDHFKYLFDLKCYIESLPERRKTALQETYEFVTNTINDKTYGYILEEELLSEQSADISNAIKLVEYSINLTSIAEYLHEFNLILDRALLIQTSALKTNLGVISRLTSSHREEIYKLGLDSKLLSILRAYKNADLYERQIDIYWVFNQLHNIALSLKNDYKDNDNVNYWLTDPWVLKFVRL